MFSSHFHFILKIAMLAVLLAVDIDRTYCQPQPGVIMEGPRDQVVAPGEIAYFNCHARGDSVYWYINGSYPHPPEHYMARGFNFSYIEIPHPPDKLEEHNNTIIVEGRLSNNNTLIACAATGHIHNQQDFGQGYLIIADPPLVPSCTLNVELSDSTFTFILSWTPPFTWPGFPITGYTITLSNYSSGEAIDYTVTVDSNQTEYQFSSMESECYRFDLSVSANNSLGEGETFRIHSGHPIIVGELGDIETVITFLSNGTPHFWMSFLAPNICPGYQNGTYNIKIRGDGESDTAAFIHQFGPTKYTQENKNEQTLIVMEVKDGFRLGGHYEVIVTAESFGKIRSQFEEFVLLEDNSQQVDTVGITVGVVSTLLIGFLVVIILILLYLLKQQRRNLRGDETDGLLVSSSTQRRVRMESSNPIYEGADSLYETTPGELLKSLNAPTSTQDSTHHYIDQPPILPPPRGQGAREPMDEIDVIKASLKEAQLPQIPESENGDVYVIMGPNSITPKDNDKAKGKHVPSKQQ